MPGQLMYPAIRFAMTLRNRVPNTGILTLERAPARFSGILVPNHIFVHTVTRDRDMQSYRSGFPKNERDLPREIYVAARG